MIFAPLSRELENSSINMIDGPTLKVGIKKLWNNGMMERRNGGKSPEIP